MTQTPHHEVVVGLEFGSTGPMKTSTMNLGFRVVYQVLVKANHLTKLTSSNLKLEGGSVGAVTFIFFVDLIRVCSYRTTG